MSEATVSEATVSEATVSSSHSCAARIGVGLSLCAT